MRKLIVLLVVAALSIQAYGLNVTNTGQTAAWLGTPTIALLPTPTTATTSQGGANGVLGETFTVLSGMDTKLDKVETYFSGFATATWTLRLVDLGDQSGAATPYKPPSYAAGTDLWGEVLTWGMGAGSATVWDFDFQGAEEKTLTVGHTYAFEVIDPTAALNMMWMRGGNVYTYGSMYDGSATAGIRDYLPTGAPRTGSMAVYLTPEPATIALLGLGLALLRKRS
jgi:hypothetical protein